MAANAVLCSKILVKGDHCDVGLARHGEVTLIEEADPRETPETHSRLGMFIVRRSNQKCGLSEYSTILWAQVSWAQSMCTLAGQCQRALSHQLQRSNHSQGLVTEYGNELLSSVLE